MISTHQNASPTNYTTSASTSTIPFEQHPRWEAGTNWKSALNNLRLRASAVYLLVFAPTVVASFSHSRT